MIRIPSSSELETRLVQTITARLRDRRRKVPHFSHLLDEALHSLAPLTGAERLKFRLLQKQFEGGRVPGLPAAVAAGRFFVRSFRKLRGA